MIAALFEKVSPEARLLLWILTRGRSGVPVALVEKVFLGASIDDDKRRTLGQMVGALGRLSPAMKAASGALPEDFRALITGSEGKTEEEKMRFEGLLGELTDAGLVSLDTIDEKDPRASFTSEAAIAVDAWMHARPEERKGREEGAIRVLYGERYGELFILAVQGERPKMSDAQIIEMGVWAADELLERRATKNLGVLLGDVVRAANDASLVGPVVHHIEQRGALDAVLAELRASGDGLGEGGILTALAGHYIMRGQIEAAIALETRALAALGGVVNSVIPRTLVHLRLAEELRAAHRPVDGAAHHLAALVYRVLAQSDPRAEMEALYVRRAQDAGYKLPPVREMLSDPAFADLARFLADRGVHVDDVQDAIDELVGK